MRGLFLILCLAMPFTSFADSCQEMLASAPIINPDEIIVTLTRISNDSGSYTGSYTMVNLTQPGDQMPNHKGVQFATESLRKLVRSLIYPSRAKDSDKIFVSGYMGVAHGLPVFIATSIWTNSEDIDFTPAPVSFGSSQSPL